MTQYFVLEMLGFEGSEREEDIIEQLTTEADRIYHETEVFVKEVESPEEAAEHIAKSMKEHAEQKKID